MYLFGLTGGIASGKSTVSKVLSELGCPIIDADLIAREVVEPGKPSWKLIVKHFGQEILLEDGHIDRSRLGEIVFREEEKRRLLNKCTHPYIQRAMLWQVLKYFITGESLVVIVSPLLFESGRYLSLLKSVIVVNCTLAQQVKRLMSRDHFTEAEAHRRINSQMPLPEKCRKANFVIDNSTTKEFTRQQTFTLFAEMHRLAYQQKMIRAFLILLVAVAVVYYFLTLLRFLF